MRKATIVRIHTHAFKIGEVVTQVAERDEDGHIPFVNAEGRTQFLDDEDFEYIEEEL